MNWKQINEQYPKAFLEWVKYWEQGCKDIAIYHGTLCKKSGNELIPIQQSMPGVLTLPDYFDGLGIRIIPDCRSSAGIDFWVIKLVINGATHFVNILGDIERIPMSETLKGFPTRREALEAGVMKAFEIREEQLKQQ